MSERVEKYSFTDEEGETIKFNYISRNCMCFGNCHEDEIELFDDIDDAPFRLKIEGTDLKWFIKGLIDGEIKPQLKS